MAKKFATLKRIDNNHTVTEDTDYEFLYHLQNGLLMALKERGKLSTMEFRHAEERLKMQRRDRANKK